MGTSLPIWIMEPGGSRIKRNLLADRVFQMGPNAVSVLQPNARDEIKGRLRKLRESAANNVCQLTEELSSNLVQKYPQVKIKTATDSVDAINYIRKISDGIKTVSINNSGVIAQEIKPGLAAEDFTIINSYFNEFDIRERKILDYWDIPRLDEKNLSGSFVVSQQLSGIDKPSRNGTRKYLAVLGANSVSAEDTAIFFLQHFSNIQKDLAQAEKIVIVVSIDKIVHSREEAEFQSQCMGIFGMENILLGIQTKNTISPSTDELPLYHGGRERELHLILLDNGRSKLLESHYKELFLCIGCRACIKHCPVQHFFTNTDYIWTPRNYLNQFILGKSNSIDICLHCEACRLECPLDIDLPGLMWQAKTEYIAKYGRAFHQRILGRPETLAKMGTVLAPFSNWMMETKLVRIPMESITGIDRKTNLPWFHSITFKKWFEKNGGLTNH